MRGEYSTVQYSTVQYSTVQYGTEGREGKKGTRLSFLLGLEGMAAYGRLLLAPAEGWWPWATWRALQALFSFRYLEGLLPIIFI